MKRLFWGFLLLFLSFDLNLNGHSLDVLPDFAGYLLLLRGMGELANESSMFQNARPFAVGMTIYTAVLWIGDLLAIVTESGWLTELLGFVAMVVALYIAWMLLQGVMEIERSHAADLQIANAYRWWKGLVGVQVAAKAFALLANLVNISIILVIVAILGMTAFVLNILYLVAWWKSTQAYEQRRPQSPEVM